MRFLSISFSWFSSSHIAPSAKFRAQRLEFHKHCQDLSRLAPWRRTLRCISMLENRRGKAWTVMTLKKSQKNKSETKMNICDILQKKKKNYHPLFIYFHPISLIIWDWLSLVTSLVSNYSCWLSSVTLWVSIQSLNIVLSSFAAKVCNSYQLSFTLWPK